MKFTDNIGNGILYIIVGILVLSEGKYIFYIGASVNLGSYKYIVSFIFLFLGFFYIIRQDK